MNPEMGVAPVAKRSFTEIFIADVEAADESFFSVHYENFAVVAEVDAGIEEGDFEREEDLNSAAGSAKVCEEFFFDHLYADRIKEYPHFDTCCGAFCQEVDDLATEFVGTEDVVLHVDVVLRGFDGFF